MSKKTTDILEAESGGIPSSSQVSRRKFLNYAGASAVAIFAISSCSKMDKSMTSPSQTSNGTGKDDGKQVVNLGSGDKGILNYAYALEQLEAAFYTQVVATPYSGMSSKEKEYFGDIKAHEIAHREFFKNVLGNDRIGGLMVNFSTIDFTSRDSVLATSKAFEDLGVSAYNGAGELLQSPDYLLYAGKIVSVEARHAATIRDLISYGSFADSTAVNSMGLDLYRTPPEVLAIASAFTSTKIIAKNLPTT